MQRIRELFPPRGGVKDFDDDGESILIQNVPNGEGYNVRYFKYHRYIYCKHEYVLSSLERQSNWYEHISLRCDLCGEPLEYSVDIGQLSFRKADGTGFLGSATVDQPEVDGQLYRL
jgi:hypothetical protein